MRLGRIPLGQITSVIRGKLRTYTVTRETEVVDDSGFVVDSGSTDVDRDVWLFQPDENRTNTDFGNRLDGDLNGLCLPSTDLQHGDRLTHGPHDYELDDFVTIERRGSEQYVKLSFVRVTE